MDFTTRCVHAFFGHDLHNGANLPNINFSVIYSLGDPGRPSCYRRYNNANSESLAAAMRSIYGLPEDFPVTITNCGLSAFIYLCMKFEGSRRVVTADLDDECLEAMRAFKGETVTLDMDKVEDFAFRSNDLVFAEPISNPMLKPYDAKRICEAAHKAGAKVVIDNSLLSVANYNPFDDGADIVLESGTKWLCGSGDAMLGILLGVDTKGKYYQIHGVNPSPIDCYLVQKGIPTLPFRMARIRETGAVVADWVKSVTPYYSHDPRIGLVTFCLGDTEFQKTFCSKLKLIFWGPVFGQSNTTIQASNFVKVSYLPPPMNWCLRLSCGLEDGNDLVEDLKQAYEAALASGRGRTIKGVKK